MDFTLPEELTAIRDAVRRFMETEARPATAEAERAGRFPRAIIRRMGEQGFFGTAFPEAVGGSDVGFQAVALVAEEISRVEPGYGYCMNMQAMTCPLTIYNWGTDAQVARYVPDLIAGKRIGMFALSEPGGGSDPAGAMKTVARRHGQRYVLSGSKMWITFADECDAGILFAKTDPGQGHRGISCFILEPKTLAGYRADPIAMSGLSRAFRSCAVFLDEVQVPAENRLGEEGQGFQIAMNALEYGRLTVAARLVGLAQACLDEAARYAKERVIKGSPIGRYQMVQHLIADMAVEIEAARLLVRRLGWLMDQGRPSSREASQAKYFASRVAKAAAQAAQEIFGGYALADEYPIQKFKTYVDMLNVGEGAPAVQRILIAEDALGYKDANRHALKTRVRTRAKAAE